MSEHKFKIAYNTVPLGDGKTKAEIQADPELKDFGATDEFILVSTLLPEDGSRSVAWTSSDAEGNSLPDVAIFQTMVILARSLALNGELDNGREGTCWAIWNAQLAAMDLPAQDLKKAREMFGTRGKLDS